MSLRYGVSDTAAILGCAHRETARKTVGASGPLLWISDSGVCRSILEHRRSISFPLFGCRWSDSGPECILQQDPVKWSPQVKSISEISNWSRQLESTSEVGNWSPQAKSPSRQLPTALSAELVAVFNPLASPANMLCKHTKTNLTEVW